MVERLVLDLADASDPLLAGGKAFNLHLAKEFGLPVPPSLVVTVAAWRLFFEGAGGIDDLRALLDQEPTVDVDGLLQAVRRMAAVLRTSLLPERVRAAVNDLLERQMPDARVAVRSFGVAEDSSRSSFAGQLESMLNVLPGPDVEKAIVKCWLSGLSERMVEYQLRVGLTQIPMPMGVLIQRMVDSDCGGVLFSRNPVSGNEGEMWISSNLGLGTTVVDGSVVPDSYVLDRTSGLPLVDDIHEKTNREDNAEGGGVIRSSVEPRVQSESSLDVSALRKLWELGATVEDAFGMAVDLEWALSDGRVFLLQVRPITR